jgi:anti-anti-sigma factor
LLQVRRDQTDAALRVVGRVTMNQCPAVRQWADHCLTQNVQRLSVDLSGCTYMDSTFVGTLLALYRRFKDRQQGGLTIIAPSPACKQVLQQMHLLEIFRLGEQPADGGESWSDLPREGDRPSAMLRQVVSAHQELASLPGEVGENFRGIAKELTAEMGDK